MVYDPFLRMHKALFAKLGKEGFLRTTEQCMAVVDQGEVMTGEYGEVVAHRTSVDIFYAPLAKPRVGDTITVAAVVYTLDVAIKDDGYSAKWIVL